MLKSILGCCKLYISESRNKSALESIERASKLFPNAPIVNKFEDVVYNRVGYTLVSELHPNPALPSSEPCHLISAVLAMVKAAFETIDFELHSGTHPRLGVVDHICFHPLADASLDHAAETARCLATDMGSSLKGKVLSRCLLFFLWNYAALVAFTQLAFVFKGELASFELSSISLLSMTNFIITTLSTNKVTMEPSLVGYHDSEFNIMIIKFLVVPTYLYGAAHEEGRTLDSIRRTFGYFKPNSSENQWIGSQEYSLPLKPDNGPAQLNPAKGVVVIGATNWVDNYNVPLLSSDISAVRRIAKRISGRGGGLPSVQAMALAHGDDVIEVACNLLDPKKVNGEIVQQEVERLAKEEGISVGRGYFTDFSQEEIIQSYLKLFEERI
uniref:glutamate formimidoyltransferase n=1 Tax=Lupinus angustifolius TaxID=3871 RepID=L0P0V9_LUPAN|nr:similar to formimidoyltransferase-cyclodeaminase-like [Lupinus angustifolius]